MEFETVQGVDVPKIGLGTWKMPGKTCYLAVRSALELGYRHIDTAELYENEKEVGRAMADSGVPRSEIFLVTKVMSSHLSHAEMLKAAQGSLRRLGLDQIDVYLVHWPNSRVPIADTMRAMNKLVADGLVRLIGVSNFSIEEFEEAQAASEVRLFTNQVSYHIREPDDDLRTYCQRHDVLLTAYSPLARGRLARDRVLTAIGKRHGKTASQVALRWAIQQEKVVAIPKSASAERQRENLDVFDFGLSPEDLADLASL